MVEQINSIAQLWSSWMWPMFWQVSLLVVFIALADLFLRKRVWPQVRYALWLLVLIKLVIPPGFALSTSIVSQIRAHAPQKDTSSVVIELKSEEPSTFNIASENILPDVRPHIRPITFLEEERFALPAESTFQPYINSPVIVPEKIRFDWKAYLMIGWLAGVITLLFWAIMRYKALRKKFCTQIQKTNIPKWFEPLLNETAKRLKLRKIPQIAFSDNISSPAVFGTFKPVLILSSDISLSQKSMEHILLHELAHIKRLDLKVNTLTTLLQIVYWFNPLLFFTGKRLRHLRELCCDATVARILREQTSDYRMTIMESASRYFTKPTELGMGLLGLFEDSSSLANRLKWLEKKTWKYRTIQILTTIVVVTLMALYILPMAKAEKVQAAETSSSLSEENPEDEIDPKELISCTGNIVDNQGKPVEGAEITVYERFKQGSVILRQVGKTITSNTEGKFVFKTNSIVWIMRSFERIGELEQGLVVIQKDGFAIEWTSWDMNSDIDMNVTLTKPQSIDGIVIDETGESIPKAEVHAIVYKSKQSAADISNWLAGISPIEELQTTTDTQGKFKINNIPENSFVDVFVKAKDKAITCTYNNELGPAFKAGQTNIRAVLADEGRIEGKIIDLSTGKGVAGLKITVTPDKEKEGLIAAPQFSASYYNPLVCVSKEDGTFSIGELPEDKYILLGNFPSKNRVVVEKGKTTSDVTIECPAIVYGRVLGPDGKPYANADVQIRQVREPGNNGGIAAPNIKTDQFGNYLYADISWPYTMGVLNDEKFEDGRGYRGNYVKKKETFEGTQQVDFQLGNFPEGTANLAGEVKDQNNKPITEFIVQLNNKIKIEEKPGQSYSDFGITQIFYTTDGKFEFKNLPDGEYTVSLNSLQTNGQYEFPIFQETVLEKNKTTTVKYDIIKKQAYYGRVLFDDGTPAYFDPPPWPIASVTINVPSQIGGNRISVDKNGYFKAFLKDDQYESIKNGEFKMDISVPSLESERLFYSTRVSFPPDKLSTDKSRAGSIEIPKPSISLQLNPANAPSLLQQQIPDFNGIEINQNSEKEDNTNITIRGYVTDTLGRSRGNVYIAPETTNVWYGKRSDLQGHFVLEDVTPEQKKWVAYSQVSQAFGLFTIPDNYNGEPIHVTLDFVEASAEGRVIGEQGRGLPGQDVELVITTKDGLTYIFTSSQKTDLHGNYEFGLLPFGPGLKIQAKLTNTSENNKKYSTKAVNLSDNQIFVEMPTLVIGDAKPEQYDDGKILYSGRIINEQNQPVQGARVEMMYRWQNSMGVYGKEVMTDENGKWQRRLPNDLTNLSIGVTHPQYTRQRGIQASPEELQNGTHILIMKKGIQLQGIVKNTDGEPISNALVDTGGSGSISPYGELIENYSTPRTLPDGSFSVGGLEPKTINIVVSAQGYAPKIESVDIVENIKPLEITLDKGRTYTCQVVDANDNPIEGVSIDIGDWRIGNERKTITRITKTDSQGIFKIENLPDVGTIRLDYGGSRQPLLFFSREIPEDYPEIDKVVMYKVPIFTGKVIDAQTEKPITKFRLTSGIKSSNFNNDGAVRWSTHYKDTITSEEGKFSYRWSGFAISYPFDGQCELKIEADGYLYETAPPITLGQQYEPAVIRMTKGEPFSGTITDSENKPIPGAEVGWIGPDSKAFINNGKFDQRGLVEQTQVIVKTDINGQFELPPSRNEGLIVVVHENKGYASISSEDFENGSKIQLNPWAKIEGTIISSDETRKEYTVLINTAISDEELSAQKIYWMFDGTSYSQKDFVINYVPPVPVYICQYIDSERMKREYLEPQPGQTYKVELSDEPAIISGRIIEPDSLEGKELPKMNDIEINSDNEPTDNSMNLICFWDFEQRPSRNMITQLSKRIQELEEKGILVLTINTSDTEQKVLDDWLKEQNINLKVGKITADIEKTKFNWGVKSLPWLILTDKNHIVIAEGFNLEDLNEKISSINKENNKASDVMASFQKQLAMIRGTTSNPDTTSKISDNGPKAVIKGKYISKHNDLDLGNQEIFVITTYPERSQRKINTLEDGSFIIPDIPANAYGYLSIRIMNGFYPIVTFPDKYSFFSKNESSIYFDNIPAGTYESIEYDFLKLGHVSGQVTDCNDKPLKGLWIRTQLGSRIWKTDDYGEFFIEAMPNEDLILNVTRDGYSGKLFSGNKFRIKEGEEIVKNVKLSEEMSIKIEEIIAEENRIFDTELTGKVVTKDGKPVSGAKVFLGNTYITMDYSSDNMSGKRAKPTWEQGYFWAANVESRPDGSFKFNKLIPGKSDIWAEHPELGWGYLRNVSTDSKDVKLVLEPQPEKIKYTGKVVDSENKPSANAKIYLFIDQGKTLVEQTQSKADGSFEFEFKPPWTNFRYFVLLCISEDQQPAWTSLPYCSIEDIQIKLKSTSRILGKVVDSKGKGIANAVVQYYCADDPDYGMIMFSNKIESVVPTTKTDNQGNYVMENVPLGSTVSFEAKHPTHVSDCVWYIPVIGKEVKGDNIEMDDGAIIEGTVRYANTNEPAKNVRVIARTLGTTYRQVITDNDDKYIIEGLDRLSTSDKSVILAESMESPPEWEGQTYLKRDIRDGLHLTNVDVLLQNSFLSQKQNWLARRGKIVDGPKMIVLDNCFSPTSGKTKYEDTLTMFNSNGKEQWQCSSLNISQSTGPNKSIVYNPVDKSIWCAERVGDRLIKMDLNGNILLELEDIKPNSLAVDPKTGNVWVLTIDGLVYGDKLLIFDLSGKKIKELYHNAFNITYSKKEDCFWIVGQEIIKLNRNGEDLMYWPGKFSFISVSVSINENDGSAWIVERGHPQAPPLGSQPSQDCIWIIEPNGDVRKKIKIELPMNAIVDSQRSVVWVTTYNGVFKMSLDGEILESIPVKGFDLCIEPETGYVWVTSNDGIYRLDSDGKLVWSKETAGGSQKWLCAIPN